jgi:uncharacterized protein YgbK (DUF1537 family)
MPSGLRTSTHSKYKILKTWSEEIVALLNKHGKAILAIGPDSVTSSAVTAKQLREITAACVHAIYNKIRISEMIIEGGSTASAVVSILGFNRFFPVQEITFGVVRMRVESDHSIYLTIKPGSYAWSQDIWTF